MAVESPLFCVPIGRVSEGRDISLVSVVAGRMLVVTVWRGGVTVSMSHGARGRSDSCIKSS